jgi:hypothetical protein
VARVAATQAHREGVGQAAERTLALGLDVSARATGYCVMDARGASTIARPAQRVATPHTGAQLTLAVARTDCAVVELGRIVTAGMDRYQLSDLMARELQGIHARHTPAGGGTMSTTAWLVGAEDYMRRYVGPRRNLFALAEANITTCLACFRQFGATPVVVHPSTARASVCIEPHIEPGEILMRP